VNEVRLIAARNSAIHTAEQTEIARFWSDFNHRHAPAISTNCHHDLTTGGLSLIQNARLFALLGIAQADAAIVFGGQVPIQLVASGYGHLAADEDNNPETEADAT
jgi:hypothetical protein